MTGSSQAAISGEAFHDPIKAFPGQTKLLLFDEDDAVRDALSDWLADSKRISVAGTACTLEQLQTLGLQLCPDVIVTEIVFSRGSVVESLKKLRSLIPGLKVLFFTGLDDPVALRQVLEVTGASCILKDRATPQRVEEAIVQVADGERLVGSGAITLLLKGNEDRPSIAKAPQGFADCCHELDATEAEILEAIRAGETNRQIASRLSFSERSIKRRILKLYAKLGVQCRSQAAAHFCTQSRSALKIEG